MGARQEEAPFATPQALPDPGGRLSALLASGTPRLLIGLAGPPGAGKSTLAVRLAAEVNARHGAGAMLALSMDGFHLTRAQLQRMPDPQQALLRRGAPWTFDPAALAARLQALRAGAGATGVPWPDFQHDVGDPVEDAFLVPPFTRLILVEGLYLLCHGDGWTAVAESFDERWYLDTPFEVALERLVARHMSAWNWTRQAAEARIAANDRLNAEIVLQSRPYADFLIPG
jgi:pantothenate kinase